MTSILLWVKYKFSNDTNVVKPSIIFIRLKDKSSVFSLVSVSKFSIFSSWKIWN